MMRGVGAWAAQRSWALGLPAMALLSTLCLLLSAVAPWWTSPRWRRPRRPQGRRSGPGSTAATTSSTACLSAFQVPRVGLAWACRHSGLCFGEHPVPGVDGRTLCQLVLVVPADVGVLVVPGSVQGLSHCVMSSSTTPMMSPCAQQRGGLNSSPGFPSCEWGTIPHVPSVTHTGRFCSFRGSDFIVRSD